MRVLKTIAELQASADRERAAGQRIALVPTMGMLHEGHLSLVREARCHADRVWVSIFVNPTQFDDPEDLCGYPRNLDADLAQCTACGVDVVFAPDCAEMIPSAPQIFVEVAQLAESLCGNARPGHFRGVATVVAKLLLAAKPHVAVFGEKDFQQLSVIRRLVDELGFDVEIVAGAIVREADGLALSSRNVHLDPEARRQATVLVRALDAVQSALESGECNSARLLDLAASEITKAPLARIDYVELRDPDSLDPAPLRLSAATLLALAVFFPSAARAESGEVRLIDNRVLAARDC